MKVREVLTPLVKKKALKRLCRRRDLPTGGKRDEILRRLARSYRGDLSVLIHDLRQSDLLTVASAHTDSGKFPARLRVLPVSELREVCLAVFEDRYVDPETPAGVVPEERVDAEWHSDGPYGGDFRIALHRTGCDGVLGTTHVNENMLAGMAKNADSVTIMSAYYVPEVLETVAGTCRGDVRVVLNGLSGRRLNKQVAKLKRLQKTLRERSRTAEIRLAFAEGMFHTKLYVFRTGCNAVAWIGSANATKAGLNGRNEEVLVRMEPTPQSVLDYADSAWSRAMPVKRCRQKVNSLIALFRTGMLYYKPHATLQMTMNPFRRLMESLPTEERRKITAFRSEYAVPEAGIGAFNLNLVFERAEEESREQAVKRPKFKFRPYAVETCYGYWVAEPFIGDVDRRLAKASAGKRRRLKSIRKWMKKDRCAIVRAYVSYLNDVRGMLNDREIEWHVYAAQKLFEDTSAVERRLDSLLAALAKPRLARHCQAFAHCEVPEIWEDADAYTSFADSFFESLADASSAKRRSKSAKLILDCLDLLHVTAEEVRTALEGALGKEGWYEDNFGAAGGG